MNCLQVLSRVSLGAAVAGATFLASPHDARAETTAAPDATATPAATAATLESPTTVTMTSPASAEGSADRPASRPRPFGTAGSIVLEDLLGIGIGMGLGALGGPQGSPFMTGWIAYGDTTQSGDGSSSQHYRSVAVAPSVDVFVSKNVSIGGLAYVAHSTSDNSGSYDTTVGVRPRIGLVVPLGHDMALWLRGFGLLGTSTSKLTMGASADGSSLTSSSSMVSWGVGGEGLFVASVARYVALTFGPTLSYVKSDGSDGTGAPSQGSWRSVALGANGGISLVF